jgi:hypothetical protein
LPIAPWKSLTTAALALTFMGGQPPQEVEDPGWPREIRAGTATILIYQPQPESFEGNTLSGRAAISVERSEGAELQFGAVWLTSRVETDRDARVVSVLDVTVDRVRFPDAAMEQEQALSDLLEREIPRWDLPISLDRLLASLEVEEERIAAAGLLATPPRVLFATTPSVLVSITGEPRLQPVENSSLMRVINTPFAIIFSSSEGTYYLHAGGATWYTAQDLSGEWAIAEAVPADVAALAPPEPADAIEEKADSVPSEPGPPPAIVVATEPTELIVTEGDPEYTPISGTDLLYVANTESDVLLEIGAQRYYIVLSGRWYASDSLTGTWTHVPPGTLPATFAQIPPESEMGHLLMSVPGTTDANEAMLDAQIPQTAAIQRSEAHLEVTYDGEPQFEPIEGTEMAYAANTSSSVVRVGEVYYACEEAVWFMAESPHGPWLVADEIAEEISTIPPSAPVYNVTYVHVYNSTPDVVYVGYYPGYMHSYVYGGTIVYGTGWYYTPWYGAVYYPRPVTWGYHVRYNPWYGWSFGFSYGRGPFTFSIGWGGGYRGGYWGPMGYRGYRVGYHRGWHAGYRAGARAGYRAGYRAGSTASTRNNIYNRPQNRARNTGGAAVANRARPSAAPNRSNNVYADRNGNVHRQTQNGWQSRAGNGWQGSGDAAARAGNANRSQLDRSRQARDRGAARTQNFQRSGAARSRGGGGRRR